MNNLKEKGNTNKKGLIKMKKIIDNSDWIYAGGDFESHWNYFNIFKKDYYWGKSDWKPKWKGNCVCGELIERNCWLYNKKTNKIIVIGSKCINKFKKKQKKLCSICGEEHRNIIVNKCNDCRIGLCDICGCDINEKYSKCYNCKFN